MLRHSLEPAKYERSDVGLRFIWLATALVTLGGVALVLIVLWLYPFSMTDRTLQLPLKNFPEPRLQQNPPADWARIHAQQLAHLNTGASTAGAAHIPIETAMRKIADEGIADWPVEAPANPKTQAPIAEKEKAHVGPPPVPTHFTAHPEHGLRHAAGSRWRGLHAKHRRSIAPRSEIQGRKGSRDRVR